LSGVIRHPVRTHLSVGHAARQPCRSPPPFSGGLHELSRLVAGPAEALSTRATRRFPSKWRSRRGALVLKAPDDRACRLTAVDNELRSRRERCNPFHGLCLLLPLPRYILPRPRGLRFDALVADHPARDQWYRARCRRSLTLQMNDFQLESIMRLRLDMLNNRRRLRIVTTAAILVACAGTQAARNGARPAAGIPTELRPFADDSARRRL